MFFNSANLCRINILTSFFLADLFLINVIDIIIWLFLDQWEFANSTKVDQSQMQKRSTGGNPAALGIGFTICSIFFHFQIETFALGPSFYLVHRIESGTLSKLNPSYLRWSFHFFPFQALILQQRPLCPCHLFSFFQWISVNCLVTIKYRLNFFSPDILVLAPSLRFLLGIL